MERKGEDCMDRLKDICKVIESMDADALLLTSDVNVRYATGATGLEGLCLINRGGEALFLTDGRYIEAAQNALAGTAFTPKLPRGPQIDALAEELKHFNIQKLLYEDGRVTVRERAAWAEKFPCELAGAGDAVEKLRARKTAGEIERIEQAQRIAEAAFERFLPTLREGVTEREAAARLEYEMAMLGSEKPSFETILLFGENTSKPHGVPSKRRLREGDLITADFGAVIGGYHSDMTRTFAFGHATEEQRRVYETVLAAQRAALEAAKASNPCSAMHFAAADVIEKAGYGEYFTHSLGHSVGLEIHESPNASPRSKDTLEDGVVITNEPGIYLPGKFGVRIEDMLLIHGDAPVNLTKAPKTLIWERG